MSAACAAALTRWLLVTGVALMAFGATWNAVTGPTWGGTLQAVGLLGMVAGAVGLARGALRCETRQMAVGAVVLWAVGTFVTAVAAPRLGEVIMAASAVGAGALAVGWARSTS